MGTVALDLGLTMFLIFSGAEIAVIKQRFFWNVTHFPLQDDEFRDHYLLLFSGNRRYIREIFKFKMILSYI